MFARLVALERMLAPGRALLEAAAEQLLEEAAAARALVLPAQERIALVGDLRLGRRDGGELKRQHGHAFERGQQADADEPL